MHALWTKRPDLAAHNENVVKHQDNTTCHITRNTLLEIDAVGFQRAIHQHDSTDLAPLDIRIFSYFEAVFTKNMTYSYN